MDFSGSQKAVWNADGSAMEFTIDFPQDIDGKICGWAIALADNDREKTWNLLQNNNLG